MRNKCANQAINKCPLDLTNRPLEFPDEVYVAGWGWGWGQNQTLKLGEEESSTLMNDHSIIVDLTPSTPDYAHQDPNHDRLRPPAPWPVEVLSPELG